MFRLTRETRFAIDPSQEIGASPTNSYAGFPSLTGLGHYFSLRVTLAGELNVDTAYLRNIKDIDEVVRKRAICVVADAVAQGGPMAALPTQLFQALRDRWPGAAVDSLQLNLSPFLSIGCLARELPMVRLSQKFEFAAAHRLNNPALSADANRRAFGKCNNAHGHGHNYELQVTLVGQPDTNGLLIDIPAFERIVAEAVIERFDHRFLNIEVPEFAQLIPSAENIAKVIYGLLKPRFEGLATLASVTVWETPKTWCEYSE